MFIPVWVFKLIGWLILGGLMLLGVLFLYVLWVCRNVSFKMNW